MMMASSEPDLQLLLDQLAGECETASPNLRPSTFLPSSVISALGHDSVPLGRLPGEVFQAHITGKRLCLLSGLGTPWDSS